MFKRLIRKIHKWVGVGTSLFLFAWLVSGIIMVVPVDWLAQRMGLVPAASAWSAPGFRQIEVTIPAAIAALETELEGPLEIVGVQVTTFQAGPAYQVALRGGLTYLVDAISGEPVVITETRAEAMARDVVPGAGRIASSARIESNDFHYFGPFPAYKISFEEPSGNVVYVSATGSIRRTTPLTRMRRWITSLHDFGPLTLIDDSRALQVGALVLLSLLALLVLASGLYMALPTRRRARRLAAEKA